MTPPALIFDHLAVAATTLQAGTDYVHDKLGAIMGPGGKHPRMGTHNALARLGSDSFLEVIAVDPDASPPGRARWFGLDQPGCTAGVDQGPRLAVWVARTPDIEASLQAARAAGLALGPAIEITRGPLSWLISVPQDGHLPEGGTLPVLIQWPPGPHPAQTMSTAGVTLARLVLRHPEPARLDAWLRAIAARDLVQIDPVPARQPGMTAVFRCEAGALRNLSSDDVED